MALHGRRLDALWKLSNNTALNEEDMTRALLTIAAAALRPGHAFSAHLLRIDGDVLFVEETISRGPHAAWLPNTGARIELDESLFRDIARAGGMRSCADTDEHPELAELRVGRETGARSFIGGTIRAGSVKFVVALVSTQPVADAFNDEDLHFMDVLATLLGARLERRLQRARILARNDVDRANAFLAVSGRAS